VTGALATATRVLRQLRHDRRTLALLLVVPVVLLALVRFVVNADGPSYQRFGLPLLGIFPLLSMFLVTSIAMLRERTSGTLERLLTTPLTKLDLLAGYGMAFAAVAVVQAGLLCIVGIALLDLDIAGSVPLTVVLAVANAVLGMALGLFLSAFATSEFQAVQFMPAFLLPQLLLCGITVPRDRMAAPLHWLSEAMPLTYAYDGFDAVRTSSGIPGSAVIDLAVVLAMAVAALALGAATLRRRTE
jgi:ABC-2 type transport system permease protein